MFCTNIVTRYILSQFNTSFKDTMHMLAVTMQSSNMSMFAWADLQLPLIYLG